MQIALYFSFFMSLSSNNLFFTHLYGNIVSVSGWSLSEEIQTPTVSSRRRSALVNNLFVGSRYRFYVYPISKEGEGLPFFFEFSMKRK